MKRYFITKEAEITKAQFVVEIPALEVSDGYHTMSELYEHRYALFCALVKIYDNYITPLQNSRVKCWKSLKHEDGTMFENSFIAGLTFYERSFNPTIKATEKHITYHIPLNWWDKFKVIEVPNAPKWDGHTSNDVIKRLMEL